MNQVKEEIRQLKAAAWLRVLIGRYVSAIDTAKMLLECWSLRSEVKRKSTTVDIRRMSTNLVDILLKNQNKYDCRIEQAEYELRWQNDYDMTLMIADCLEEEGNEQIAKHLRIKYKKITKKKKPSSLIISSKHWGK